MAGRTIAPVHHETLRWAREVLGCSLEDIAKKLNKHDVGKAKELLELWESGEEKPSIPQAKELAKWYRRTPNFLYLLEIPDQLKRESEDKLPDFRRNELSTCTPNLNYLMRQTRSRQNWLKEYFVLEKVEPLDWLGTYNIKNNPEEVGRGIYQKLEVDHSYIQKCANEQQALDYWSDKIEKIGTCIFQSRYDKYYKVDRDEVSGFAISDDLAPIVVLQYQDKPPRKIFTLAHELVHLFISEPGISHVEFRSMLEVGGDNGVERFCNQVAAAIIMPEAIFDEQWQLEKERGISDIDAILALRTFFKVSASAIAVRAATRGYITHEQCETALDQARKKYEQQQEEESKKTFISKYHKKVIKKVGLRFSNIILEAYEQGAISALEVGNLLDVNLKHLSDIAGELNFPLSRWGE